ncbi:RING finger protein 37 [Armadillidium vulgare]|nr:RING finger protein 37 [Armadillidium vulgare]
MDFCSSFLGTKISVNKPCRDGFSVTNLISDSKEEFLCEGFVRTPVNIDIKFILPIDIYCILINTEVRERKIAGLKLFANTKDSEEYCVGNWFSLSESQIILKNYEYRHLLPFSIPKEVEVEMESSLNAGSIIKAFKTRSFKNVGVSSLQLVLTSVSPNGPPGLKRLQIWDEEKPIPEEFLDILTCEVMRLPILLPSGNSIDSSSLEKFLAIEATWGRSPSDPFTGIPFKENHKPEPNILLKARIDRFLLIEKNSSCLDGLGHTLLTNYIEKGPNNSQVQESKRLKLDNSSSRSVVSTNTSHRNSSCSSIVNNK